MHEISSSSAIRCRMSAASGEWPWPVRPQPPCRSSSTPEALTAEGLGFAPGQRPAGLRERRCNHHGGCRRPSPEVTARRRPRRLEERRAQSRRKMIVAYGDGTRVELRDIATIVDGPRRLHTGAWFGTKPSKVVPVFQPPSANRSTSLTQTGR